MKDDYAIVKRIKLGETIPAGTVPADLIRTSTGEIHVSTATGTAELVHADNINIIMQAAGGAGWEKAQAAIPNYVITRPTSGASLDLHIETGGTLAAMQIEHWPVPAAGVDQLRIRNFSAVAQTFSATGFSGVVTADGNPSTSGTYSIPVDMAVHITIDENGWIQVAPMGQEVSQAELNAVVSTLTDGSVQALFDTIRADAVTMLPAATALNTLTGVGWFNVQTPTNAPTTGWWYIYNAKHRNSTTLTTNYGFQLAKKLDVATQNDLWMRVQTNGTWTTWRQLATTNFNGARVGMAAAQSIPNAALTTIAWTSETYDTNAYHDNVTNNTRLTAAVAGYYRIGAKMDFAGNATGSRALAYRIDAGVAVVMNESMTGGTSPVSLTFSTEVYLTAGQYIDLQVWQSTGGAFNLNASSFATISFIGS